MDTSSLQFDRARRLVRRWSHEHQQPPCRRRGLMSSHGHQQPSFHGRDSEAVSWLSRGHRQPPFSARRLGWSRECQQPPTEVIP
jgi:hypothetical protein